MLSLTCTIILLGTDIPNQQVVIAYFTNSEVESGEMILGFIEVQNETLNSTMCWSCKNQNSKLLKRI